MRYHLAQAFKGQNRNAEALQQVKIFLKEERAKTTNNPEIWAYWQQRVGNEIGNELYQEGDYVKALQVYLALAQLDPAPAWQLPVRYQVGITYEKLLQPEPGHRGLSQHSHERRAAVRHQFSPEPQSRGGHGGLAAEFSGMERPRRSIQPRSSVATDRTTNLNSSQP